MFKRTKVSTCVLLALGGALLAPVASQAQQTQRIEITGSAIKRTSAEGPAPVEVVSRKDIERTGATSVNELLRSIPSIDIFDQGELASNSPAGSGTANIRLRGLSESDTLVLLNGRRLPVNALYDSSGAGAAFDINSLPIGAIERVEILKDGGSAIYGADAVAGVVNFITKTDYQGIEGTAYLGTSSRSDGEETRLGLSAGFGDLSKDRFNLLFGLDYFKREPILRKDRDISKSVNFTRFGSGDFRSSFAPTGNVINPDTGAFVGVPYAPCPAENLQAGTNICRYDFNASLLTAYNGADRLSALAVGTVQLTPNVKGFAELTFSTSKDKFQAHPVPDFFLVPITDPSQAPYEYIDPVAGPTGQVYIAGRFMQGGPRISERKSDFLNAALGLEGSLGKYDWKASVSRGESKVRNSDRNYYDFDLWTAATSNGSLNPTISTNDPAFVESLKVTPLRTGKSTLSTLNLQLNGEVMQLPAGPMLFAVGAAYNKESLSDQPDALSQAGNVVGSIQQAAIDASRSNKAAFVELGIPVLKNVEVQAALRHDRYPNASATSPKIGAKWDVAPELALRASYSRSFRAPALKQLFGASEQGAINITDPAQCAGLGIPLESDGTCLANAFRVTGSNPDLQPEKGKTLNVGAVFEPSRAFSASVDWWRIEKTNDINTPTISQAIEQGLFERDGPRFTIFQNLQNIAGRKTEGVDVDARLRFPGTALGNFTLRNLLTYYITNQEQQSEGASFDEFNGTYRYPRFRNSFSATLERGAWTFGGTLRTVGGFWDTEEPRGNFPDGTKKVRAHEELDVLVQYGGIKNLELGLGIKNLLDKIPPFSAQNARDNNYTQMGFAELYTSRGRFFYVTANYTFR